MLIDSVYAKNFRSYGDATLVLPHGGLTIIQGTNGAGKSSIVSAAVLWCLFGETPDGVTVKDLRRQGAPDDEPTEVTVTLHTDGREVVVTRALKGKNLTTVAEVTVDGTPMADVKSGAATAFVEGLLGVDAVGFRTAYLVQQKSLDGLVRQTAAARKKTIERLSGIDRLSAAVDEARGNARALQKVVDALGSSSPSLTDLTAARDTAAAAAVDARAAADAAEANVAALETAHEAVAAALRVAEQDAREAIAAKAAHETAVRDVNRARSEAEQALKSATDAADAVQAAERRVAEARAEWTGDGEPVVHDTSDLDREIGALRAEVDRLTKLIAKFDDAGSDACPTCGQTADTTTMRAEAVAAKEDTTIRGKALAARITDLKTANATATTIIEAERALKAATYAHASAASVADEKTRTLEKAETALANTAPVEYDEHAITVLETEAKNAKQAVDTARAQARQAEQAALAAERATQAAENSITVEEENQKRRAVALANYELGVALADSLDRFRSRRLASLAPALSESASTYLCTLTDGALVSMELSDTFEPIITAADGGQRPVAMLSGGEESVVALSLRLAIGDEVIAGDGSLLVLDEILGALDEERRSLVTRTLRDLGRQVVLVHHGETEFADAAFTVTPGPDGATVTADA